jgi:putative ABC transport system permease protein
VIGVALKGLAGRKLRAALTAFAIVLGVAMVSGSYILTDTISKAFKAILADSYEGTSAVISGKEVVEFSSSGNPTVPGALLARVEALPEVEAAAGGFIDLENGSNEATLIDKEGQAISPGGDAPTFGFGMNASDERFSPLRLAQGRWASARHEVAIDAGTAEKYGFEVGDAIGVAAGGPVEQFTLSGLVKLGSVDSIGNATISVFDVATAQALFDKEGQFDSISVAAAPGVSPAELVRAIEPVLPSSAEVKTAAELADAAARDIERDASAVRYVLFGFGGIALFVGAFVILNTLSITVAQRTREFATLRTLGASRRQVLRSVLLEGLVLGLFASVVGLFLGLGLAVGMDALFAALGIELPEAGTVFAPRTVIVSLLVGTTITVLASLVPALRATRVPPIAAVREGATLPRSRLAPFAPWIALATIALGVAAFVYGLFAGGLGAKEVLLLLALGCLALFVGVALIASRLVRPIAALVGWPAGRLGGSAGKLARANAVRNPGRTAATAAALMIGLALVTFVAVLGQVVKTSFANETDRIVQADYLLTAQDGFSPLPTQAGETLGFAPGVELISSVRNDSALVLGEEQSVVGIDPATIATVSQFEWTRGSENALTAFGGDGAILFEDFAKDRGLQVGERFALTTGQGKRLELEVKGTFSESALPGPVAISQDAFDAAFARPQDVMTFVNVRGDASTAQTTALERALTGFPDADVQTKDTYVANREGEFSTFLNVVYGLLALSVVVSLFGMVNTLVLSVFERTREIGMLRAVGMTRRQARRMIRHESVITALIGAALGMPLGIFLAGLVTVALRDEGLRFSLPASTLVVFALIAVTAGIFAAILPARRASRLNVLEALQYE